MYFRVIALLFLLYAILYFEKRFLENNWKNEKQQRSLQKYNQYKKKLKRNILNQEILIKGGKDKTQSKKKVFNGYDFGNYFLRT